MFKKPPGEVASFMAIPLTLEVRVPAQHLSGSLAPAFLKFILISNVHRLASLQRENTALCSELERDGNLGQQPVNCLDPETQTP